MLESDSQRIEYLQERLRITNAQYRKMTDLVRDWAGKYAVQEAKTTIAHQELKDLPGERQAKVIRQSKEINRLNIKITELREQNRRLADVLSNRGDE